MKRFFSGLSALIFVVSFSGSVMAADCSYVASKGGEKYHNADCGIAKNIKAENKVCFQYPEEAKSAGYSACGICKPAECTKVVASKDSYKYHLSACGLAKNIKKDNLVEYSCAADAAKAGKTPCGACKPPKVETPKVEAPKADVAPKAETTPVTTKKTGNNK